MDMNKHYIEFCDNIFAIEDVLRIVKHDVWDWKDDNKLEKVWKSYIYFNVPDRGFYFPESEYEKIKQIFLDYSNNKKLQNIEN